LGVRTENRAAVGPWAEPAVGPVSMPGVCVQRGEQREAAREPCTSTHASGDARGREAAQRQGVFAYESRVCVVGAVVPRGKGAAAHAQCATRRVKNVTRTATAKPWSTLKRETVRS
jgi:hypothetical protein